MASGGSAAWPLEVSGCSPTSVIGTTHESPTSARLVRACQSDNLISAQKKASRMVECKSLHHPRGCSARVKGERRALPTMHEGTTPSRLAKDTSLLASASLVAAERAHPTQRLLSADPRSAVPTPRPAAARPRPAVPPHP